MTTTIIFVTVGMIAGALVGAYIWGAYIWDPRKRVIARFEAAAARVNWVKDSACPSRWKPLPASAPGAPVYVAWAKKSSDLGLIEQMRAEIACAFMVPQYLSEPCADHRAAEQFPEFLVAEEANKKRAGRAECF